jgi:hypothetical protein
MSLTTRSDLIVPEVLADAVRGAFAGMTALLNTGAAIVRTGLPNGMRGGDKVKMPYFGIIGELEDLAAESDALTPAKLSMTSEEASVAHSGKAFESTRWAQLAAQFADPYGEAARQMRMAVERRADKALIDVAKATLSSMTKDVYSATVPRTIDWDLVVDGKMLWGDEQDDIILMCVHSKVYGDLLKLKDGEGRPLLVMPADSAVSRFCGIPVKVSDRLEASSDSPAKYTTLLLKRGALAFWFNDTPSVDDDKDILADTRVTATHVYWAAHRYSRLEGYSKGGVVILKHN